MKGGGVRKKRPEMSPSFSVPACAHVSEDQGIIQTCWSRGDQLDQSESAILENFKTPDDPNWPIAFVNIQDKINS